MSEEYHKGIPPFNIEEKPEYIISNDTQLEELVIKGYRVFGIITLKDGRYILKTDKGIRWQQDCQLDCDKDITNLLDILTEKGALRYFPSGTDIKVIYDPNKASVEEIEKEIL